MVTFNQLNPRCFVTEYLGANRARFECVTMHHTFTARVFDKPAPNGKYPGDDMIKKMCHWWGKANGGCIMKCPKCES